MIVVDDPQEPQSPGERSPLKSPSVTTRAGLPLPQAPPPPYAATNAESSRPYFPVPSQGHLPPPVTLVLVHRRSAVRRFLRALAVAIFVLFLWGLFVDSLSLRAPIKNNKGGRKHVDRRPNGIKWLVRNWYRTDPYTPNKTCPCLHDDLPTTTGRPLPVQYPPVISRSEDVFSIALPTTLSTS